MVMFSKAYNPGERVPRTDLPPSRRVYTIQLVCLSSAIMAQIIQSAVHTPRVTNAEEWTTAVLDPLAHAGCSDRLSCHCVNITHPSWVTRIDLSVGTTTVF